MDACKTFEDILVVPYTELLDTPRGRSIHRGGPIWPDFETERPARHNNNGRPIDHRPEDRTPAATVDLPSCYWGGPIVRHFGHQVADFSTRILPALVHDPEAWIVLSCMPFNPFRRFGDIPRFYRQILRHYGATPERVLIVTQPTLFRRLTVFPQQEQTRGVGPSEDYLRALERVFHQRFGPVPRGRRIVYVSRARLSTKLAGEAAIEEAMAGIGADIFHPETVGIFRQLRRYASASELIFSEGSAVHGLQLLGRGLGDVSVIRRRPGHEIAKAAVTPRARSLTYHDHVRSWITGITPAGAPAFGSGITVLDPDGIHAFLARYPGAPGLTAWRARYQEAARADVQAWVEEKSRHHVSRTPGYWQAVAERLEGAGIGPVRLPS